MDEAISASGFASHALGVGIVVSEDPMMAGDVARVPGGGRAAAGELRRNVHDRHEVELHSTEGFGLMKPEQPALVQELLVLAQQHPGVFGPRGALTQDGHDLPRAPHRLGVADGGEIAALRLRQRAHGTVSIAGTGHDHFSPPTIALPGSCRTSLPVRAGRNGARPDDHRKVTLLGAKDAQPFPRR